MGVGFYFLLCLIGYQNVLCFFYMVQFLFVEEVYGLGFVYQIVEFFELFEIVNVFVCFMLVSLLFLLKWIKLLVYEGFGVIVFEYMQCYIIVMVECFKSDDYWEGVVFFLE